MTRFLMSLDDAVDLVIYAFNHARQGDIFVQKAPASTIFDVAQALKDIFSSDAPIEIIGTRHGEKLFESLISREEMVRTEDMGRYYRIPADDRDLNYRVYFSEGMQQVADIEDYTSHNTERLGQAEVKALLLKLDYVQAELTGNLVPECH
jgi:UDP-glucose 4-epimerase